MLLLWCVSFLELAFWLGKLLQLLPSLWVFAFLFPLLSVKLVQYYISHGFSVPATELFEAVDVICIPVDVACFDFSKALDTVLQHSGVKAEKVWDR